MTKAMTSQTQLNLSVVALVALVAIVGLVALVLNAASAPLALAPATPTIEQAAPVEPQNLVGDAKGGIKGKAGSTTFEFEDYDQYDHLLIFTNRETGEEKIVATDADGNSNNFVHDGQVYYMNIASALAIDTDQDGKPDVAVVEDGTFTLPDRR